MPELDHFPPVRDHHHHQDYPESLPADPAQIQNNILEEQVELWWFRDPRKSLLCYCVSILLILGCGLGGVGLLSTTTSVSSEWRLGVGTALCLLALGVLLKQLLSSAVQDMNCGAEQAENRHVEKRRAVGSAGGFDHRRLASHMRRVLLHLALANHMPKPGQALNDMYISGVVLLTGGGAAVAGVGVYAAVVMLLERTRHGRRLVDRVWHIFTVSGHMDRPGRRETTSSLANLI